MIHTVTIHLSGMPKKRGPRLFRGVAGDCVTALRKATAQMPDDVRRAFYTAEPTEEGTFASGLRKFRIVEKHKAA